MLASTVHVAFESNHDEETAKPISEAIKQILREDVIFNSTQKPRCEEQMFILPLCCTVLSSILSDFLQHIFRCILPSQNICQL